MENLCTSPPLTPSKCGASKLLSYTQYTRNRQTCAKGEKGTGRSLALQESLGLRECCQHPTKGAVSSTNQNAELLHVAEGVESGNGTALGEVVDLVGVEVTSEGREKLHPLVTATLSVDKHQQRLLTHRHLVRLRERSKGHTNNYGNYIGAHMV